MNKYTKLRPGLSAFKRAAALLLSAVLAANLLAGCSQTRSDDRLSPSGTADGEAVTLPQDFDSDESNTESSEPEQTDPVESTGQSESLSEASESESLSSETSSSPESLASEDSPAVTTLPSGDEPASSASSTAASSEAEIVLSEVFSEPRTMYASDSVNVRSGPGTGYERLGHLDRGDEVSASAISENGWYKIAFKGGDAFVSGKYLQDSMPDPEVTVTAASSEEESSMSNLSSMYQLYCIAIPKEDNILEDIINFKNEYLILQFSRNETIIKFSEALSRFLESLKNMNIQDIIKVANEVGAGELKRKLLAVEQVDFEETSYRYGGQFLKDIIYTNTEIFMDLFYAKALLKYQNGIYFDNFLPSGYMAIIHDIHYWDNHRQTTCQARMMCVGSLVADYQSFYKELGVSSFV